MTKQLSINQFGIASGEGQRHGEDLRAEPLDLCHIQVMLVRAPEHVPLVYM